ncbi:MAG: hypothetical protein KDC44_12675 [Phaeodactylibacter sp.]|nr:hypothetical protein [Phaeodactylibacter sp.]
MRFLLAAFSLLVLFACQSSPDSTQQTAASTPQLPVVQSLQVGGQQLETFDLNGTTWLAENLVLETPDSWCFGNEAANCAQDGRLYRHQAALQACQQLGEGWVLPSESDYKLLAENLGGYYNWLDDQTVKDPVLANKQLHALGFTLSGFRGSGGGFENRGQAGFYWTATTSEETQVWMVQLGVSGSKLTFRPASKGMGMSCRCVRYPK